MQEFKVICPSCKKKVYLRPFLLQEYCCMAAQTAADIMYESVDYPENMIIGYCSNCGAKLEHLLEEVNEYK